MESKEVHVLFVCLGNICRSPTAEGVFRHVVERQSLSDCFEIDSAGTSGWHIGEAPDRRAVYTGKQRGIDLSSLKGRQVVVNDFSRFDYILAMDKDNLSHLTSLAPAEFSGHLGLFLDFDRSSSVSGREVPDPYYGGDEGFEHVFDMIERASEGLLEHIRDSGKIIK